MYTKRQKLAMESNRVSLSPEPGEEYQDSEDKRPYKPTRPSHALTGLRYNPNQLGYKKDILTPDKREEGYSLIRYGRESVKDIPKKLEWQAMSQTVDTQLKQVLSDVYSKTLLHVAGSTSDDVDLNQLGKRYLQPLGKEIHQRTRKKLFPGSISEYLLRPDKRTTAEETFAEYNVITESAARLEFERTKAAKRLEDLEKRLKQVQEEHKRTQNEAATYNDLPDDPNDYVQMLLKYPSFKEY